MPRKKRATSRKTKRTKRVPKGHHQMPDGSVMKDSDMKVDYARKIAALAKEEMTALAKPAKRAKRAKPAGKKKPKKD